MTTLKIAIVIIISTMVYGCVTNTPPKEPTINYYGCTKNFGCPKSKTKEVAPKVEVVNNIVKKYDDENKEIATAIYSKNFDAFAKEYKQLENKDSISFTQGHFKGEPVGYLPLSMYLPDPRFFNLVVEYADPNAANFSGLTALFLAADFCAMTKAKKLIAKGANVNYVSKITGVTPLHMVVGTRCYQLAKLLIKHGANKQAKTFVSGSTPYDMSVKSRDAKMMKLLKF